MPGGTQAGAGPIPTTTSGAERRIEAQLRWRCRRGVRELDLLLEAWLERQYPHASGARRAAFAALLELADNELARYLLHGEPPEDRELGAMVEEVRQARQPGAAGAAGTPVAKHSPRGGGVMSDRAGGNQCDGSGP